MRATVHHDPAFSRWVVSATAERGRDGIDLPIASVVAGSLTASPDREATWIDSEPGEGPGPLTSGAAASAHCYVSQPPTESLLGAACVVEALASPWRLDAGWLELGQTACEGAAGEGPTDQGGSAADHVSLGEHSFWLGGGGRGGQGAMCPCP